MTPDPRISAPSALRNRGPILEVLQRVLPATGLVLEVASGTGEHVTYFAEHLSGLTFQPTEPDAERRASIDAWTHELLNVRPSIPLDAAGPWPDMQLDAVICINMIHISPWDATLGLLAGASKNLRPGGVLMLYGPYLQRGVTTAEGNIAFDADLRARNPLWGLREVETVAEKAAENGFVAPEIVTMPANNLTLLFSKPA